MASRGRKHAKVEDMSLFGTHVRMGPTGLWVYASSFLRSAKAIEPGPDGPRWPAGFYLVCHALELSLKAFLSVKGRPLSQLADLGHDLERLAADASAAGLHELVTLASDQISEVQRASRYYVEKVFEYPALAVLGLYPGYRWADMIRLKAEDFERSDQRRALAAAGSLSEEAFVTRFGDLADVHETEGGTDRRSYRRRSPSRVLSF